MRSTRLLATLILLGSACYHATVETGRAPAPATTPVVEDKWADSWLFGLVRPKPVKVDAACPAGVAKVETELSFLNQAVGFVTFGIYTPMRVKTTCAAPTVNPSPDGGTP